MTVMRVRHSTPHPVGLTLKPENFPKDSFFALAGELYLVELWDQEYRTARVFNFSAKSSTIFTLDDGQVYFPVKSIDVTFVT